jgi:hypothetical protein
MDDPGCSGPGDDDETDPEDPAACSDGVDNDGDGNVDMNDPGCSGPGDDDETDPEDPAACSDGVDNDGDGVVDMDDPGCSGPGDDTENPNPNTNPDPACSDGADNDGDGKVDMADPGCSSPDDNDETDPAGPGPGPGGQGDPPAVPGGCADGVDNNGNGVKDIDDPACHTDGNPKNDASYDPKRAETTAVSADVSCAKGLVRLIEITPTRKKVRLYGVAPKGTVGKQVKLRFKANRKIVATAVVQSDLTFRATAKMPKRSIRKTNRAQYRPEIKGKPKGAYRKLYRRGLVNSVQMRRGKIVYAGKIVGPFADGTRAKVRIRASADCSSVAKAKVIKTVKTNRKGAFKVKLAVPKRLKGAAAVYLRAQSRVASGGTIKAYNTYTETRGVMTGIK